MDNAPQIALVCFIADPFDPPGYERFGGGHLFLFDLGRFLVQYGYGVVFFTRRNSPDKPTFEQIGPLCSIHRVAVGPPQELDPSVVGMYLDELTVAFDELIGPQVRRLAAIHSHYWIAGEVVRRFCGHQIVRHLHSILSLGRLNREKGEPATVSALLRDECEVRVFNSANVVLAVCPSERADLERLYPEVDISRTHIVPYGVDPDVFYPRPQPQRDFVRRQADGFPQGPSPIV